MLAFLAQIIFTQPIILTALVGLPVLWYILRITPPAPRKIFFPPARFLGGLVSEEQTPSTSPWWILLLRLMMVALLIFALARPVINPADALPGRGDIRLIIDNSWASAPLWDVQMRAAEETIIQAAREGRAIYVMPSTPALGEEKIVHYGPMAEGEALSVLRGLKPNAWPADYDGMIEAMEDGREESSIHTLWLSHGLDEGNLRKVVISAQSQGSVSFIRPAPEQTALLLRPTQKTQKKNDSDVRIDVDASRTLSAERPVTVQALGQNGNILDLQSVLLSGKDLPQTVSFEVAEKLRNTLSRYQISGRYGAGGVYLLDDSAKKRKVGIAATRQTIETAPLIEAAYYIQRALEPFATIVLDEPKTLIEQGAAVIILPDVAAMPTDTLNALENWVNGGGLLLRFAGPSMADARSEQFLLPVTLRAGGRSLSGSLSWDEPQSIAPFKAESPFYGLEISDDIHISQQVLADPAQDLEGKVWASLTDGTPFITAATRERGVIVLIHTTANADWSDFALSGLYVSALRRIVGLAGQSGKDLNVGYKSLEPLLILDGSGALNSPPVSVRPLPVENLETILPSSVHPPGLYGRGTLQYAFNLGIGLEPLMFVDNLPLSVYQSQYDKAYELDLMPYLLYLTLCLFLVDWLVMIFVFGTGLRFLRKALPVVFLLLCTPAFADEAHDIQYAAGFYLAHIKSGDSSVDSTARRGLERLAETLEHRTSIKPKGIVHLDPSRDTLAFFPLIYWPISAGQGVLPDKAISNIQYYLDHGGTILFDLRDRNRSTAGLHNTSNGQALQRITASLNIPPIIPIPETHVLGRSFYLLKDYPGKYSEGTLWVEQYSAQGRDNVSSVIIGSNDWGSAWAENNPHGSARQNEMAMRFGVNLVMYALTGNYKEDQVHIPHILKRLDR